MPRSLPWSLAATRALYGPGGFFVRGEGPAAHFRTSANVSDLYAAALLRLLVEVDDLLGHPTYVDVVDVGAGRGELLVALGRLATGSGLVGRLRLTAVELAPRPPGLPPTVAWEPELPDEVTGLLVANEWLDDVPLDVVEVTAQGEHVVLVDPASGQERAGDRVGPVDAAWLRRWWPLAGAEPGDRAEVGRPRDAAWSAAVRSLRRGLALAVDYGHLREERAAGAYAGGTLTGYRGGRAVPPVPDGSCDLTAHVAVDACLAAGTAAGARDSVLLTQRDALRRLGLSGARPDLALARSDPTAYAGALQQASDAAELLDPAGLGGFWWLAQSVDLELPVSLRR